MIKILKFLSCTLLILLCLHSQGQDHPRGLIQSKELRSIKNRLKKEPYQKMFQVFSSRVSAYPESPSPSDNIYTRGFRASDLAGMYLLTDQQLYAERAFTYIRTAIVDTFFQNPLAFGLTRAMILQQTSIAYDFCYQAWSESQRKEVNDAIRFGVESVHSSMGFAANYNIASNWMGVRYGAVILGTCVWDPPKEDKRNPLLPYRWDSNKRLLDHMDAVIYENGWHGESLGYAGYDWSFVGPGLVAFFNQLSGKLSLAQWMPKMTNFLWPQVTTAVDIQTGEERRGMKPDLSDDNLNAIGPGGFALAMRLMPDNQQSYLKGAFDYRFSQAYPLTGRLDLLLALLYYPDDIPSLNPANTGWLSYHDPEQGVLVLRDQFQDSTDIVFTLSATSRRVRGHSGPDTHTWRLQGLGVPWVVGGGRTGITTLQTNFFPDSIHTPARRTQETGLLHDFGILPQGGWARSSGSCVGLSDHIRYTQLTYDESAGCSAAIFMEEQATEGRRWRIQTPEFNEVQIREDGYRVLSPNGASMEVKILSKSGIEGISTGTHRYGGKTVRNNPGIHWQGKSYEHTRWIDIACEGKIDLMITLQEANKAHPAIQSSQNGSIQVGEYFFYPSRK